MLNNIAEELTLSSLSSGIPTLTKIKASMLKEACIWCLLNCNHSNCVQLAYEVCGIPGYFILKWDENEDFDGIIKAYNPDDAVEYGAEAIALLLIREKTSFTAIQRAVRTTGIDYWLGYKNTNPNSLFSMRDARLEISGILRERDSNTIKNRIKIKLKQTEASDYIFPVFISVIEFGQPKAETVKKDA